MRKCWVEVARVTAVYCPSARDIHRKLMMDRYQRLKLFMSLSTSLVQEGPDSFRFRNSSMLNGHSIEWSSEVDDGGSLWLCLGKEVVVFIRCSDVFIRCITESRRRTAGASSSSILRRWVGIPWPGASNEQNSAIMFSSLKIRSSSC